MVTCSLQCFGTLSCTAALRLFLVIAENPCHSIPVVYHSMDRLAGTFAFWLINSPGSVTAGLLGYLPQFSDFQSSCAWSGPEDTILLRFTDLIRLSLLADRLWPQFFVWCPYLGILLI
jgi:hypothetical protein